MNDFESKRRSFVTEVKHEAAKLIERGVPPWNAVEQGRKLVSYRRRQRFLDDSIQDR